MERLQKIIAASGLGSRRQAEEWIQKGKVTVNGKKVSTLGTKASPEDDIRVDGKSIPPLPTPEIVVLHKPRNCMVTRRDPQGRPTIYDLLPSETNLLPVGRLDFDSEGLLLLTTDRTLIHRLTHPRFEVPRTYEVKVKGDVAGETLNRLEQGDPSRKVKVLKKNPNNCWAAITLKEGKNRQVRQLFAAAGHPVLRLKRVAYGPVRLGDLPPGKMRSLNAAERTTLGS